MIIELDLGSETPIYEQLIHVIVEGIATKELKLGEPMPSVRALAADIGINMHTVNKAYKLLKNEGFLLIHRQKGVVVNPDQPDVNETYKKKMTDSLRNMIAEAICRGISEEDFREYTTSIFQSIKKRAETKWLP